MSLWYDFLKNDDKLIFKWMHYFPIYEKHFSEWKNKTLTFIEIGVLGGGSLQMWKRYFGPFATIIGVDINPECKQYEEDGVHIRIGDQSDPLFLQKIIEEFGQPDIVLDDGSHQMKHVRASFDFLYPNLTKNGVYMIEDMHTAYWEEFGGGKNNPETFINISKNYIDDLNADHSRGEIASNFITKHTFSINYYDSIVAFQRGDIKIKKAPRTGLFNLIERLNP
ncbi:class I SAM-dependent methyltransferase [Comamonas composti]|uniref:class I SAM-dependent methyltransferase n=1 Tax=Comamonas composti TaxID=408558 RepID=UPI0004268873|nr:class I SAM-dependent methyltransferase [Comamonas composti]